VQPPQPPSRAPHYFDNEIHRWENKSCAQGLIGTLVSFVSPARDFRGDATGHIWPTYKDTDSARLAFSSSHGHGHVQLTRHETNWIKAEVFISGELKFRAWLEETYEEKEMWPDGADGVTPPDGDAPGRISKRGRWLQVKRADFPGVPEGENAYWSLEDTYD